MTIENLMNIKRWALLLLLLFVTCAESFAQEISHDELVEVLGIKSWRVPLPKDEKWLWTIEVVDYEARKYTSMNTEKLNLQNKSLIVLRDMGKNIYQLSLKQRAGMSQGDFEINICSEKEIRENSCDNNYGITWHDVPKPYDNGMKFVIADITTSDSDKPVKQIILELSLYRLEDMIKEGSRSP